MKTIITVFVGILLLGGCAEYAPTAPQDPGQPPDTTGTSPQSASIVGRVWLDTNENGTYTAADSAFAGLTVSLSGTQTRSTQTRSAGTYEFAQVSTGEYTVHITNPDSLRYRFSATAKVVTITTLTQVVVDFRAVRQ